MAWYNNILGTGTNIFGAGTSMDMDKYKKAGLLEKNDLEKAQKQSLTRGLLGTAIGYLAQPQNQNYGSITPYLAKGFQQGMQSAQEPFKNLQQTADTNAKLNTIITNKENTDAHAKSIDTFIASHPEYAGIKNMPMEQQAEIMKDFYKPVAPNETAINKEKTVKALAGQIMQQNPGMSPSEAEGKARIQIAMKPLTQVNMGDKGDSLIQGKIINHVFDTNQEINRGIQGQADMQLASNLVEQASSAQGFGAGAIEKVSAIADRLGIPMASNDKADILRTLKSVQIKLALGEKKPGTGPMTDKDFDNYLKTTVNIDNPQATNRIIAYISAKRQEIRQAFGTALNDYVRTNGYDMSVFEFEKKWNEQVTDSFQAEMKEEINNIIKRSNFKKRNPNLTETEIDQGLSEEEEVMAIIKAGDLEKPKGL